MQHLLNISDESTATVYAKPGPAPRAAPRNAHTPTGDTPITSTRKRTHRSRTTPRHEPRQRALGRPAPTHDTPPWPTRPNGRPRAWHPAIPRRRVDDGGAKADDSRTTQDRGGRVFTNGN